MEKVTDIAEAQMDDPKGLRSALLGQLGYLVDEIEALRTVVGDVPDQIKNGRPSPDALSMKELYAEIATLDTEVRRPRVGQVVDGENPAFESADPESEVRDAGWNEQALSDILDQVIHAREVLVDQLAAAPLRAWHHTALLNGESVSLFDLVYRMTQTDADRLRNLGHRLHNAHLSDRDKPLPT